VAFERTPFSFISFLSALEKQDKDVLIVEKFAKRDIFFKDSGVLSSFVGEERLFHFGGNYGEYAL